MQWYKTHIRSCFRSEVIHGFYRANSTWTDYSGTEDIDYSSGTEDMDYSSGTEDIDYSSGTEDIDYSSGTEDIDYSSGTEDTSHNSVEMEFQPLEHKAERSSRKGLPESIAYIGGNSV